MIALYATDNSSGFGIATLLDLERIPYRHVAEPVAADGELLLIAGRSIPPHLVTAVAARPALIVGGDGPQLAEPTPWCAVRVAEPAWSARATGLARRFGVQVLHIPARATRTPPMWPDAEVLARFAAPAGDGPAVLRYQRTVWARFDVGSALVRLLSEDYEPGKPGAQSRHSWWSALGEAGYYRLPEAVRQVVRRRVYAPLRRVASTAEWASTYPADATGWLALELVRHLVLLAAGAVVRVAPWPAPWPAAAIITHDIEPRRYAYRRGLPRMLDQVPATERHGIGLVATATTRHLAGAHTRRLRPHVPICHGWTHHGERDDDPATLAGTLAAARARLEECLQRPVRGYRSPRLARSPGLLQALDASGFAYDSSYPDVDRETTDRFGQGVRLNFPYWPPLRDGRGGLRPSRCLELPLTAPDCIQPLFLGEAPEALRADVAHKAAFVRDTGGLYVALIHAGVFGNRDAARREAHLVFVREMLRTGFWLADPESVTAWWTARSRVCVRRDGDTVTAANGGDDTIHGLRVVIEHAERSGSFSLPPLAGGTEMIVTLPLPSELPPLGARAEVHLQ